uniref:uncharacterized protein LOC104266275 n=1 Tax=Ciona intestinalis TaxID=7719 RepID=UPI000521C60A|nr:uncharacterized protein LOC104266275 [Ciona intestinalis]|eukprot:XP_009860364.1 uncharacterized protein LOC104266275 [Ciona intestinalis]
MWCDPVVRMSKPKKPQDIGFYALEKKIGFTDLRFLLRETSHNNSEVSTDETRPPCTSVKTSVKTTFTAFKTRYHVRTLDSATEVDMPKKRRRLRKRKTSFDAKIGDQLKAKTPTNATEYPKSATQPQHFQMGDHPTNKKP